MTKTLIIHPQDKITDFLKSIYKNIPYKTIITGGVTPDVIVEEIKNHDRIFMMGHGCPYGLFTVGNFPKSSGLLISEKHVPLLKGKECVFIWCNADEFVLKHELKGFYSGMFISEVGEAMYCGLPETKQSEVTTSNYGFSNILGEHSNKTIENMYKETKKGYELMTENSPVAKYNFDRLYCNTDKILMETKK